MTSTATPNPTDRDVCLHCGHQITTDYAVNPPRWTHHEPGTQSDQVPCPETPPVPARRTITTADLTRLRELVEDLAEAKFRAGVYATVSTDDPDHHRRAESAAEARAALADVLALIEVLRYPERQ